jgi:hypothetical protein
MVKIVGIMKEEKIKHLEFIQNIITRHNTNSFQIKGLTVAIVSALLAVYASNNNLEFIWIGIIPTILFWFLDSYYLQLERKFRGLYNDVACVSKVPKEIKEMEMRPDLYKGGKYKFINVLFSNTMCPLYLFTSIGLTIVYFYLKCN